MMMKMNRLFLFLVSFIRKMKSYKIPDNLTWKICKKKEKKKAEFWLLK